MDEPSWQWVLSLKRADKQCLTVVSVVLVQIHDKAVDPAINTLTAHTVV